MHTAAILLHREIYNAEIYKRISLIMNQFESVFVKCLQEIIMPQVLYKYIIGVKCRVIPAFPGSCHMKNRSWRKVKGSTNEDLFVIQELDEVQLNEDLKTLRNLGIDSLAVVLAHSYTLVDVSV